MDRHPGDIGGFGDGELPRPKIRKKIRIAVGEYIIELEGLTKNYGAVRAVDNLSLTIKRGEIFGLLGPNGAGKTTTILMMLGLSEPTSGKAWVCNMNATKNPIAVKRRVGYMPD